MAAGAVSVARFCAASTRKPTPPAVTIHPTKGANDMPRTSSNLQKISLAFAAGSLGGLANAVIVWLFGALGVTTALGVQLTPALAPSFVYQKMVWGGIWGWLFLIPTRLSLPSRALLFSLGPTCAACFAVLPLQAHKGLLGLQLGYLTPVFVLFYNAVWGLVTAWWLELTRRKTPHRS